MASAVVSVALNSLQLIYLAYTSVKNNKQRCARLVERCQLVVSRLELIVKQRGDKDLIDKIGDLEKAFKMVAVTIQRIGHQGWLRSLIHSDEDALAVEQCHRILTDLIELFNMQEIIDIGLWQKENEAARREDHQQLLQVGKGIETGNASIRDELVAQGATINQVLEIVRSMSREQQDGTVVDTPVQEPTPRRPGPHTLMDNTKSLPAIPTSINIPPPTIATPPIPIRSAPLERSNTRTRLRNSFPSLSATLMGLLTPGSSPKSGSATLVPELGFESDTATDSRNKKKKGNVLTKFKRGKSSKDVKRQDSVSQTPLDTPTQQLRFSLPEMPKRSQTDRPRPRMQPSVDSTASTADSTKSVANSSLTKASRESVRADDSPIPSVGDSPVEELQRPRLSKDTEETSEGTIRGRRPTPNLVAFPEQSRSGSRTRLSPNPSPWPDRQSSPSRLIAEVKTLGRKLGDGALLDDFELLGSTSLTIVKEWIDTPSLVAQTIRFDGPGRRVFLRIPPSVDIRNILREASEDRRSPSPRSRRDSFQRTVFMMASGEELTMVAISDKENRDLVRWAVIPWTKGTTVAAVKEQIASLLGYASRSMVVRTDRKAPGIEVVLSDGETFEGTGIRTTNCDLMVEF